MQPGEFSACCRIGRCWEDPSIFVDKGNFVRHMCDEHDRQLLPEPKKRARSGGFPAGPPPGKGRAAKLPQGVRPGDSIVFADRDAYRERTGTVWSAAQKTSEIWVSPDDVEDGSVVLVTSSYGGGWGTSLTK